MSPPRIRRSGTAHRARAGLVVQACCVLLTAAALGCDSPRTDGTPAAPSSNTSVSPPASSAEPPRARLGRITGTTLLSGKPPEMKVPARRRTSEFCKEKAVVYNAVRAQGGKLQDVFVRIENGGVPGVHEPPKEPALLRQLDCMYVPRIQGAMTGQEIVIRNDDGTLHNAHPYKGSETLWGSAQPKGAEPIRKELGEPHILKLTCDVHPWMRGFVIVSDHPFFAISGEDGAFLIRDVPPGTYVVEAWHTLYGQKRQPDVLVKPDGTAEVSFTFATTDREPPENRDELKDLF
jgi:hypothetical protein